MTEQAAAAALQPRPWQGGARAALQVRLLPPPRVRRDVSPCVPACEGRASPGVLQYQQQLGQSRRLQAPLRQGPVRPPLQLLVLETGAQSQQQLGRLLERRQMQAAERVADQTRPPPLLLRRLLLRRGCRRRGARGPQICSTTPPRPRGLTRRCPCAPHAGRRGRRPSHPAPALTARARPR